MTRNSVVVLIAVVITVLSFAFPQLVSADPLSGATKEEKPDQKINALNGKLKELRKVWYAIRDIRKGKPIYAYEIEEHELEIGICPADVVSVSVAGKVPLVDISQGQLISIRDFGIPLSKAQQEWLTVHNYGGNHSATQSVAFVKTAIPKGATLTDEQVGMCPIPVDRVFQDSITTKSLAIGRKMKYAKSKFEMIFVHDFAPRSKKGFEYVPGKTPW